MTNAEKTKIEQMRKEGMGYSRIAKALGLSNNTVKSFCRRNNLTGVYEEPKELPEGVRLCKCCGTQIKQTEGRKEKKFCSDACRTKWWNTHLDQVKRKAIYEYECAYCKKPFTAYGNAHRKYCSHKCYLADRFGGDFID